MKMKILTQKNKRSRSVSLLSLTKKKLGPQCLQLKLRLSFPLINKSTNRSHSLFSKRVSNLQTLKRKPKLQM